MDKPKILLGTKSEPIQPDLTMKPDWDFATTADIHERNRAWYNYLYCCQQGMKEAADKYERYIRATIGEYKLKTLAGRK